MKLLDLYIFRKFITTYCFAVGILVLVVCVIDYSEKTDDFIKHNLSFWQVFSEYYINFILYIVNLITPLIAFIATVFVTSKLAGHTEIIAILSGGISLKRILWPYFLGALLLAGITFFLNGWVMPKSNKEKAQFEINYTRSKFYFDARHVHFKLDSGLYAYMQSYNNLNATGYQFTLEKFKQKQLIEKLSADLIVWDSTTYRWKIERYKIHYFDNETERISSGTNMDTLLAITPNDFESKHLHQETLTLPQIDMYIREQLARGMSNLGIYYVEKYQRYLSPFAIIILTMMGVVVSAQKSRQGTSVQIAIGFALAFVFLILVIIGRSMGQADSLHPAFAVGGPSVLFAIIAFVLYLRAPK
ncbi:MAG: YjgP/YjgQ family permease [Cytophagales bacterium]|nr:MAG: YjgP/YjgQ family permease [Cytophagales bacterium]TAF60848.1 MAG: YjgP/YjgQ family permease [Cytophagales bacterium]